MVPYLKLPLVLDDGRLLQDLERLEAATVWHVHPDYTVADAGTWTALALISTGGDHTGPESLRYQRGAKGQPTKILNMCPYMAEVISTFHTNIHRARLMSLKPGTVIKEHRDYGQQRYSIERGMIRVHIPVRTHEDVAWNCMGKKVPMRPGEAWYTNVCLPHSVENRSAVNRVHLVLDMEVNDWVRQLFPKPTLADNAYGFLVRNFERPALALRRGVADAIAGPRKLLGDLGLRRLRDSLRHARGTGGTR